MINHQYYYLFLSLYLSSYQICFLRTLLFSVTVYIASMPALMWSVTWQWSSQVPGYRGRIFTVWTGRRGEHHSLVLNFNFIKDWQHCQARRESSFLVIYWWEIGHLNFLFVSLLLNILARKDQYSYFFNLNSVYRLQVFNIYNFINTR